MEYFPIFLQLAGRRALVVGGTGAAAQKASLLLRAGAELHVVDPAPGPAMTRLITDRGLAWTPREFALDDLDGTAIVIAASQNGDDAAVSAAARSRGVPVNVVDRTPLCSFIMPAFVDRSPVLVAVSSGAASPVLARLVRARIESLLPAGLGRLATLVAAFRKEVQTRLAPTQRRGFWEEVLEGPAAELALDDRLDAAAQAITRALDEQDSGSRRRGEIWLVGAGPGNPELLTRRATHLMQRCDAVFHDAGMAPAILDQLRRDADLVSVDPTIPAEAPLVALAQRGRRVMRLALGEGVAGGELHRLRIATATSRMRLEIVPGVRAQPDDIAPVSARAA